MASPTGRHRHAAPGAHAKTHKSPIIANLQIARGAVGSCVQKVGEAEVLAWGGVPDILVSNEVVGAQRSSPAWRPYGRHRPGGRLRRRSRPNRRPRTMPRADAAAAPVGAGGNRRRRRTLRRRPRARRRRPGPAASPAPRYLRFGGLQAYHGSAQHLRRPEDSARRRSPSPPTGHPTHPGAASPAGPRLPDRRRRRHRHLRV